MSRVIKQAALSDRGIRRLSETTSKVPPRISEDQAKIASLEMSLARERMQTEALQTSIAALTAAADTAFASGKAEGVEEGLRQAERRAVALADRIDAAARQALGAFDEGLEGLEAVAAGLAALALTRVLEDAEARQALVRDTLRRAIGQLFAEALVAVDVSAEDFDEAEARDLGASLGTTRLQVRRDPALSSGSCGLKLLLGEMDLSLDLQLLKLRALLDARLSEGR